MNKNKEVLHILGLPSTMCLLNAEFADSNNRKICFAATKGRRVSICLPPENHGSEKYSSLPNNLKPAATNQGGICDVVQNQQCCFTQSECGWLAVGNGQLLSSILSSIIFTPNPFRRSWLFLLGKSTKTGIGGEGGPPPMKTATLPAWVSTAAGASSSRKTDN